MLGPIYKGKTYQFSIHIPVAGVLADIRNDKVTVYVNPFFNATTPVITLEADVTTNGENGEAIFEFTPALTDIKPGVYYVQAFWEVGTRSFPVLDDKVEVKPVIPKAEE